MKLESGQPKGVKASFYTITRCLYFLCKGSAPAISRGDEKQVRSALVGKWQSNRPGTAGSRVKALKELVVIVTYKQNVIYAKSKESAVGVPGIMILKLISLKAASKS